MGRLYDIQPLGTRMEWKQKHIDIWTGLKLSQAFLVGGGGEGDKDLAAIAKATGLKSLCAG